VECVNTISLQTGQIWAADEFTHPTASRWSLTALSTRIVLMDAFRLRRLTP
jgi:hypothetical protein